MAAKILVVDDEPQLERPIKQRFRRKIKNQEYDFIFALDGPQALDILKENTDTHVVQTDINMPEMDGLTFLAKIEEMNSLLKTVMVSAYDDMKIIRTAMNRGAYDFITKPIYFNDLEATINKAPLPVLEAVNNDMDVIIAMTYEERTTDESREFVPYFMRAHGYSYQWLQ